MLEKITIMSQVKDGHYVWGIDEVASVRTMLILADELNIPIEFEEARD